MYYNQRPQPKVAPPMIVLQHLYKEYQAGMDMVPVLHNVSLRIQSGEFVAIMGPSGSGKTTLMNILGCLDSPTSGDYWLNGQLVSKMESDELAAIRNRLIGFVFQGFNLLERADALTNVALPLVYAGYPRAVQEQRARQALHLVGLGARMRHKPAQLSGGQQQRVAIARALVNGPSLLLADEPTGNLDTRTSTEIMALLQALNQRGLTIVLVTHEPDITSYARRQLVLRDGQIVYDGPIVRQRLAAGELTPQSAYEQQRTLPLFGKNIL